MADGNPYTVPHLVCAPKNPSLSKTGPNRHSLSSFASVASLATKYTRRSIGTKSDAEESYQDMHDFHVMFDTLKEFYMNCQSLANENEALSLKNGEWGRSCRSLKREADANTRKLQASIRDKYEEMRDLRLKSGRDTEALEGAAANDKLKNACKCNDELQAQLEQARKKQNETRELYRRKDTKYQKCKETCKELMVECQGQVRLGKASEKRIDELEAELEDVLQRETSTQSQYETITSEYKTLKEHEDRWKKQCDFMWPAYDECKKTRDRLAEECEDLKSLQSAEFDTSSRLDGALQEITRLEASREDIKATSIWRRVRLSNLIM